MVNKDFHCSFYARPLGELSRESLIVRLLLLIKS